MFEIPIVVFAFKRDKVLKVLEVIKKLKPKTLYILADGPRTEEEKKQVDECRKKIDSCLEDFKQTKIVKKYEERNLGVYENIGLGAKWVLSLEEMAIFLEDDNLPEETFFMFCKEMLLKYKDNDRILWICGTNYLENYQSDYSYVFTRQMLPCGWASWSYKFLKYYDGNLQHFDTKTYKSFKHFYVPKRLFYRFNHAIGLEKRRIIDGKKPVSWDYQMDFSLKYYNLLGICPCLNQIRNIGADLDSTHGGTSMKNGLTKNFCEKETFPLSFPLISPPSLDVDLKFEKKIGKTMLPTFWQSVKNVVFGGIRKLFRVPYDEKFLQYVFKKRRK